MGPLRTIEATILNRMDSPANDLGEPKLEIDPLAKIPLFFRYFPLYISAVSRKTICKQAFIYILLSARGTSLWLKKTKPELGA